MLKHSINFAVSFYNFKYFLTHNHTCRMKIVFFLTVFTFILLMSFYVTLRGWQMLQPFHNVRIAYLVANISLFVILFSSFVTRNALPDSIAKIQSFIGFSYLIWLIFMLMAFFITDLVRLANLAFHFAPDGIKVIRYWSFVISSILIIISMIVGNYRFNHPEIIHHTLKSTKQSQHKVYRIVAASDLHLGVAIDKKMLQEYVAMINAQKPDIVLLAGDIADHSTEPIIRQNMAEEFRSIKSKFGVFAVSGNHEYFGENPYQLQKYLESAGVTYLRDSAVLVDTSLYIVGRDDKINPNRASLKNIIQNIDKSKSIILMDHQPFNLEEAEQNKVDLQVSGHTHNGQFFPGNLIVKNMYEVAHGYLKKGNTHVYVSSGLGIWGPQYRIGTQSELVVIDFEL